MDGYKALDLENESDFDLEELKLAIGSDGWTKSYYQRKEDFYEWKKEYFASLKNGDKIYESACGRGLNLLMTLEILEETKNLKNVAVYGNDYLEHSVKMANRVLTRGLENGNKLESVCQGDSSNLENVPSDFFDLAYTGYIDPIWDPLNITSGLGHEPSPNEICHTDKNPLHWAAKRLGELQQEATEDWFAKWVSELVRIAKPGKPIIVENVALPICGGAPGDWGGVSREWWKSAVVKYKWDVDIESIVTKSIKKNGKIFDTRYNVFMRKNE